MNGQHLSTPVVSHRTQLPVSTHNLHPTTPGVSQHYQTPVSTHVSQPQGIQMNHPRHIHTATLGVSPLTQTPVSTHVSEPQGIQMNHPHNLQTSHSTQMPISTQMNRHLHTATPGITHPPFTQATPLMPGVTSMMPGVSQGMFNPYMQHQYYHGYPAPPPPPYPNIPFGPMSHFYNPNVPFSSPIHGLDSNSLMDPNSENSSFLFFFLIFICQFIKHK
ncbi:MAG: hypothetical protein GY714_14810 [Desulfobacterales bacterium]|nr:hypothetical protein [Desulfobacterales bacterium]